MKTIVAVTLLVQLVALKSLFPVADMDRKLTGSRCKAQDDEIKRLKKELESLRSRGGNSSGSQLHACQKDLVICQQRAHTYMTESVGKDNAVAEANRLRDGYKAQLEACQAKLGGGSGKKPHHPKPKDDKHDDEEEWGTTKDR